jgi:hypothetical protein
MRDCRSRPGLKQILYIGMDNVLVDFQSGIDRVPKDVRHEFTGRLDDIPGIFALMDPMPGAVQAYRELAQLFDMYVLSTSPWENPSAWPDKAAEFEGKLILFGAKKFPDWPSVTRYLRPRSGR